MRGQKYDAYTETESRLKYAAGSSGITRPYTGLFCPTCTVVFCDVPSEQLQNCKASRVKRHIDSEHTWISLREDATETVDELDGLRTENERLKRKNANLKRKLACCEGECKGLKTLLCEYDRVSVPRSLLKRVMLLVHPDKVKCNSVASEVNEILNAMRTM